MVQARGIGCPYFAGRENMISRIGFVINANDLVLDNFSDAGILAISDGYVDISSTEDYGIRLTGTLTAGIEIPASATVTTGISIVDTCTDGIKISGACTDGMEISGACTNGINISGTPADGIEIGGVCSATGINITATTIPRAIMIGAFSPASNLTLTSARNYPLGVFGRLIADENITADVRCAWFRLRVDAGVQIGSSANWGNGLKGIQGSLKFYGGTTTGTYSWVNAGVFGSLETDGVANVKFKDGSVAAAVFAHVGLLAATADDTEIESGGTACGVAINAGASDNIKVTGNFCGLYIYQDVAGGEDFVQGIFVDDACAVTGIQIGNATTGISLEGDFTDGIKIQSGNTIVDGIEIANNCTYGLNITGTCSTAAIMIEGTQKLMFDDSAMYMYASADGHLEIVADDTLRLSCTGAGSIQFGGEPDWGAGGTGHVISGTGWDWCTSTVAVVESGALGAACAAAYHSLAVNCATHSTTSSFFGTWTELYFEETQVLTGASNAAAVWGQVECGATVTGPDVGDGDFMAAGYFNFIAGDSFTTGSYVNGVRIQGEVSSTDYTLTGSTWMAGLEVVLKSGCQAWTYGIKLESSAMDTGIDIGTCTTGLIFSGTYTDMMYFPDDDAGASHDQCDKSTALDNMNDFDGWIKVAIGGNDHWILTTATNPNA